jgi:DNA-binding CsgD family transcriptional regulator
MKPERPSLHDAQSQGVARLTAKERECLVQWLTHATAKEIAIDLGISHHAVEKRLKSARQKLGVSSTIDAARAYASAEGYGWTASHPSEVVGTDQGDHPQMAERDVAWQTLPPRQIWILAGVMIMSLSLLAALVLGLGNSSGAAPNVAPTSPQVTVIDKHTAKPGDMEAAFARVFAAFDKDGSGFLDTAEMTNAQFRMVRKEKAAATQSEPQDVGMAQWDLDKDGRLSRPEFVSGIGKLTERRK